MRGRWFRPLLKAAGLALLVAFPIGCPSGSSDGGGAPIVSGPPDITVPGVVIATPAGSTISVGTSPIVLTGTASDNIAVTRVGWTNSPAGGSGDATGTTAWTATVWLVPGPNFITVTAYDAAGNGTPTTINVLLRVSNVKGWGFSSHGQVGDGTLFSRSSPVDVGGLVGMKAVACGYEHTLALRSDGTVWGWGSDQFGQLGDGTSGAPVNNQDPVQVPGLDRVIALAAGAYHSIALKSDGTVWGWGSNASGQVGDGTNTEQPSPVPVVFEGTSTPISGIIAIACGSYHTLAVRSDGVVLGWGSSQSGQLGQGNTFAHFGAVAVPVPAPVKAIGAGFMHSLFVTGDGILHVCGENGLGELGLGLPHTDRLSPVLIAPATFSGERIVAVAGADVHSLALTSKGNVWAWGLNDNGQLGIGSSTPSDVPALVLMNSGKYRSIHAGGRSSAGVLGDGTVLTWGWNNAGQLGIGSSGDRTSPTAIPGLASVQTLAVGGALLPGPSGGGHMVAVVSDSPLQAWGYNGSGQLGDATSPLRTAPVVVPGLTGVTSISAGGFHGLALLSDGTMRTWGRNFEGQLGDNSITSKLSPVTVVDALGAAFGNVKAVSAGFNFCLALRNDGSVWSWGSDLSGQLGNDAPLVDSLVPVPVAGLPFPAVAIAAAGSHALAILSDGSVWGWGRGFDGELGDGSNNLSNPLPVATTTAPATPLVGAIAVSASAASSYALMSGGKVQAWGDDSSGQLGTNNGGSTNRAVPVPGLTNVTAISSNGTNAVVLKDDGTVWTWGSGGSGQLGTGKTSPSPAPTQALGITDGQCIAAGYAHMLAGKSTLTVDSWGANESGQLGDRSTTGSSFPTEIFGLQGVVAVSGGYQFSMALLSDGSVRTWGDNHYGQAGDGTATFTSTRVVVRTISNALGIATGSNHSLAVLADGTVDAWGDNFNGQLGDGTTAGSFVPLTIPDAAGPLVNLFVKALAGGEAHTAAGYVDGSVRTWGWNGYGQIGIGAGGGNQLTPTQIPGISGGALDVGAGQRHTMVLTGLGGIYTWGSNIVIPVLGNGVVTAPAMYSPNPVTLSNFARAIAAGKLHSFVILDNGDLRGWGYNGEGQIGDNTIVDKPAPSGVVLTRVKAVSAGASHTLALRDDGTVWAWGLNDKGQLGDGGVAVSSLVPVPVPGLGVGRIIAVAAGSNHCVALRDDGVVFTWGHNVFGQVGDGSLVNRLSPFQMPAPLGVTAIAADDYHTLVRQ